MTALINDNRRSVDIIGYDCGWGCANYACEDGPAHIPLDAVLHALRQGGFAPHWHGSLGIKALGSHAQLTTKEQTLPLLKEALDRLSQSTAESAGRQHIPLVFGGDHSSAIGTWSGIVHARHAHQRFGLVWIDSHLDCHTVATAHQGKWGGWWHGQPVAALLGHGLKDFTHLSDAAAKISASHLSIIGAHSYEPAETAFVEKMGVTVYTLDTVRKRGFAAVFAEAYERATKDTLGWGLSIDLDAFHPATAPGVGTDEADGMMPEEVLPVLRNTGSRPGFSGLEIAEFNPHRDKNHKTGNLIEKLIQNIFTGTGSLGHTGV